MVDPYGATPGVTVMVAKHRLFTWVEVPTIPDQQLVVMARDDYYFFGILQSRVHQAWALKLGTRLETRPRYTSTTSFETFPFPDPSLDQQTRIAEAVKELDRLRAHWLQPPEWTKEEILEFPGSIDGPWAQYVTEPDEAGRGTVKYPQLVAKDERVAAQLSKRTLTNLYNERPGWLDLAHRRLDEAVFAAYGWKPALSDHEVVGRLLTVNQERASSGTREQDVQRKGEKLAGKRRKDTRRQKTGSAA
jgi:hypothetical protein